MLTKDSRYALVAEKLITVTLTAREATTLPTNQNVESNPSKYSRMHTNQRHEYTYYVFRMIFN